MGSNSFDKDNRYRVNLIRYQMHKKRAQRAAFVIHFARRFDNPLGVMLTYW